MNIIESIKWHQRHLRMAFQVASWSKDTSTQVGAVIATLDGKPRSYGFNGMPRGIIDDVPERHERPEKYFWFEHGERNAIYSAQGDLSDCVMFITHLPCPDCARGIIQSGIKHVVVATMYGRFSSFAKQREKNTQVSLPMLREAGIVYQETANDVQLRLINGELMVVPRDEIPDWEFAAQDTINDVPSPYESLVTMVAIEMKD